MGLTASSTGGSNREDCPIGPTLGRLTRIIDLGEHHDDRYDKDNEQILFSFELPQRLMEGTYSEDLKGKPFMLSLRFNETMGTGSNLRKFIESWIGPLSDDAAKTFHYPKLMGMVGMISVVLNDKGKAKIGGIMSAGEGDGCPPQMTETILFGLKPFDSEVWDMIPEYWKDIISSSKNFAKSTGEDTPTDKEAVKDDGPPF